MPRLVTQFTIIRYQSHYGNLKASCAKINPQSETIKKNVRRRRVNKQTKRVKCAKKVTPGRKEKKKNKKKKSALKQLKE